VTLDHDRVLLVSPAANIELKKVDPYMKRFTAPIGQETLEVMFPLGMKRETIEMKVVSHQWR
jgi:hypothetical protein